MKQSGKAKLWVAIALVLCLVSAIGAHLLQTSGGSVQVSELTLPGSDGAVLSGVLYKPDKASAENPLPLIITGHGSFNNKEMQDSFLIELSRRGFVVFAPDSYRHGDSSIHTEAMGEYTSMVDAVEAMYGLNYINRTKVAVMGHSMGADQANNTARYYIEQAAKGEGVQKISAVLTIGCDPPYTSYATEGLSEATPVTVDYGVIEAKHDEWFFKQEDVGMDPARFLESANAKAFIGQIGEAVTDQVENGKIYEGTIGGESYLRVIYQSDEIHPMNHFSVASAASAVDFFYNAFGVPAGYTEIAKTQQIWFFKEAFNLLGLIGIFLFLYPFSRLLMNTGFFGEVVSQELTPASNEPSSLRRKLGYSAIWVVNTALPALLLIPVGFKLIGRETFVPAVYSRFFGEANTNELAGWSVAVAAAILCVLLIYHFVICKKRNDPMREWGARVAPRKFFKSLALAAVTVSAAYLIVFALHYIFGTDFRFWVLAVKTFDSAKLVYALIYMPFFFLFYAVNSIAVNGITGGAVTKEWQRLVLSCVSNTLGLAVLIYIQYSRLIADGTVTFNAMRIVNLFPLLVLIPAATIISRQYFKATHNIYTGSFVFGMFYSVVTCANTMFLGSLLG